MREAIEFTFDGISSEDMGVIIASPSGGLYNETFLPTRNIVETTVANRYKPYHQRVELSPLSFSLSIFIEEWRDRQNLRQIAKWLMKDYYVPLTFETNPDRIFYAIIDGDSSLIHNGCKDGYIELNVRCNSPFTYSHPQIFESIHDTLIPATETLQLLNSGDMTVKPKMWITKLSGDGSISIENEESGQIMTIANLQDGEKVFIDMENEEIVSDLEILNVYRHGDHNNVWLELVEGENTLNCTGSFDIEIEYELIYLAD
jgi:predicted phage tail component-like protein